MQLSSRTNKTITALAVFIFAVIVGAVFFVFIARERTALPTHASEEIAIEENTGLRLEDLATGCLETDCIPALNKPKFDTLNEANEWLDDEDMVFGISYKGEVRAYPQNILNWHEIINETIAGDPVLVSYCPLCGSIAAYKRLVGGKPVQFGVSGKLYNSNLIMYDRSSESNYWQQATGEAIIGPAKERGEILEKLSIAPTTWAEWKENHPDTMVLSRDTGHKRDYTKNSYAEYEQNGETLFGVTYDDTRFPVKGVVYGFTFAQKHAAYPLSILEQDKTIEDIIESVPVRVEMKADGEVFMVVESSEEKIIPLRTFWFMWVAFYPDTEIYSD